MSFIFRILLLLSVVLNTGSILAQVGGANAYDFLDLPTSARVTALGGSVISLNALEGDVIQVNPASLSDTLNNSLSFNYVNYIADINYGYVVYAKEITSGHNVSMGIQYLDYGSFTRTDNIGNVLGNFGANDMSINLSYANNSLDTNLSIGATVKTIYSNLDALSSWGSAVDFGLIYQIPKWDLSLAIVSKNSGIQWTSYVDGNKERIPYNLQLGASKGLKHAPLRLHLTYNYFNLWDITGGINTVNTTTSNETLNNFKLFTDKLMRHFVLGAELNLGKSFFIRMGYNYHQRKELLVQERKGMAGFSFGTGLSIYKFRISYARAVYSIAGAVNNFSLTFNMSSFRKNTI